VPCSCGDWEFRDVTITTAIAALERWCPRCRTKVLLVFRRSGHVATVRLDGTQPRAIRASLTNAGLNTGEVELLMEVAGEMAS